MMAITGAAHGVGKAVAAMLLRQGYGLSFRYPPNITFQEC